VRTGGSNTDGFIRLLHVLVADDAMIIIHVFIILLYISSNAAERGAVYGMIHTSWRSDATSHELPEPENEPAGLNS
jgi:hypothetical protein